MSKNIITKQELQEVLKFDKEYENYLLMPNEIIEKLVKCKELEDSTAIAVAYSYTYLITWLYRYAKYGVMTFEETAVKAMKKMLGLSPTNNTYDYIIKKGGVLDQLDITKTLSMTQAPIQAWNSEEHDFEFPEFTLFAELEEESKAIILNGQTMKKRTMKYPVMALDTREPIEGFECNGTFNGGGKDYAHMIPMEAFIKCMSNPELGVTAFYVYSFIRARYGKNDSVQISLNGITTHSGVKATSRDKYLKLLKQYGMIGCQVEDFVVGRDNYDAHVETEANTYWIKETGFYSEKFAVTNTRKIVSVFHIEGIEFSAEAIAEKGKIWSETKNKKKNNAV